MTPCLRVADSYRLCPSSEALTESCFQRHPLNFTGMPSLRWNDGKEMWFRGTYVSEGTFPPGSMWARNPIPRIDDSAATSGEPASDKGCKDPAVGLACRAFSPVCEEEAGTPWHKIEPTSRASDVEGLCSGDWTDGVIVDRLQIPSDLAAGDFVLGWRWECVMAGSSNPRECIPMCVEPRVSPPCGTGSLLWQLRGNGTGVGKLRPQQDLNRSPPTRDRAFDPSHGALLQQLFACLAGADVTITAAGA